MCLVVEPLLPNYKRLWDMPNVNVSLIYLRGLEVFELNESEMPTI